MVKIKQIEASEVFRCIGEFKRVFAVDLDNYDVYEFEYERILEIKHFITNIDCIFFYIDEPEGSEI